MNVHPLDGFLTYWEQLDRELPLDVRLRVYRALAGAGAWDEQRLRATLRAILVSRPEQLSLFVDAYAAMVVPADVLSAPPWLTQRLQRAEPELRWDPRRALHELVEAATPARVIRPAQPAPASAPQTMPKPGAGPTSPPGPAAAVQAEPGQPAAPAAAPPTGSAAPGKPATAPPPLPLLARIEPLSPTPAQAPVTWRPYGQPLLNTTKASLVDDETLFLSTVSVPFGGSGRPLPPPIPAPPPRERRLHIPEASLAQQELDYRSDAEARPFPLDLLTDLAYALPLYQPGEDRGLSMPHSIARTARNGGLWTPVELPRRHLLQLGIAVLSELDVVAEVAVRALAAGLRQHGVLIELDYRAALHAEVDAWLVVFDATAVSAAELAPWSRLRHVQFLEARDPGLWGPEVGALPWSIQPLEPRGVSRALHALFSREAPQAALRSVARRGEPRECLGDTLPLAAAMALAAPCDLATADELRRTFLGQLPFLRIQRVAELRGVTRDETGWLFSHELKDWLLARVSSAFRQRVLAWQSERLTRLRASGTLAQRSLRRRQLTVRLELALLRLAAEDAGELAPAEREVQQAVSELRTQGDLAASERRRIGEETRRCFLTLPQMVLSDALLGQLNEVAQGGYETADPALKDSLRLRLQQRLQSPALVQKTRRLPAQAELHKLHGTRLVDSLPMDQLFLSARLDHGHSCALTSGGDNAARIWDIKNQQVRRFYHDDWVNLAVFSHDETKIYTGCRDQSVYCWDIASNRKLAGIKIRSIARFFEAASHGEFLLVITMSSDLIIWNPLTERYRCLLDKTAVRMARFLPGRPEVLIFTADEIFFCSLSTEKVIRRSRSAVPLPAISSSTLSSDGKLVFLADFSGSIMVFDVEKFQFIHQWQAHHKQVISLAITRNRRYVLSAAEERGIVLYDLEKRQVRSTLNTQARRIMYLELLDDGFIVIGRHDSEKSITGGAFELRYFRTECEFEE